MRRVGITSDRFDTVARGYSAVGLKPVPLPCIRIEPASPDRIHAARRSASRADLLILTSPRVVSLLWPNGRMPHIDTAVVGQSTAKEVERAGGRVVVAGRAGLTGLVEMLTGRIHARGVVTIAHAHGSDPAAMQGLLQVAPQLEEHVVYRAVPVPPGQDAVDAVAFASPSAVAGWALSRSFDDVVIGAIGATTAAAVARHREADVVAQRPSHLALAEAIAMFMEVNV